MPALYEMWRHPTPHPGVRVGRLKDMDTAVRFDLPFVSVVGNNAGWNQIRYGQLTKYGEKRGDVANKLVPNRYDLIVEALGGYGEMVTEPGDIRPALERACAAGKPSYINVILDPDSL